jgi:uncharacterized membrane protein YfcA
MYRQPLSHAQIRETLVLVFAFNAVLRLVAVSVAGEVPPRTEWWGLLAVPAVVVFSYAARRWPPPLSQLALRRGAFLLLMASGLSLGLPALTRLVHLG